MKMDILKRYVHLQKEKKRLDGELKEAKKEIDELDKRIVSEFEENGVDSMAVDGMTVFLKNELWASAKDGDHERANEALKRAGLGDLIQAKANAASVSAFFREQKKLKEEAELSGDFESAKQYEIPDYLTEAFKISEGFKTGARQK